MAEKSSITANGTLVSREEWTDHVSQLRRETSGLISSKKKIKQELIMKLATSVEKRIPDEKFGLLLSGGVDSSLIAQILKNAGAKFNCYGVGVENSRDLECAKKVAECLRLPLRCKVYDFAETERLIKKAVKIIGKPDVVNVGVAAVEIAAASLGRKDGISTFFGGLGSEEIFAGYQRHAEAEDINEECWRGLASMHGRDLVRDSKIAAIMKVKFLTPYLDADLIRTAMKIPGNYKINKNRKKAILREAAMEMGLPEKFALRKKLAAQYGSGFDKAIEKLGKKNGFKYKKDYLKSLS